MFVTRRTARALLVALVAAATFLVLSGSSAVAIAPRIDPLAGVCDGLQPLELLDGTVCTHGPDHAPAAAAAGAGRPVPTRAIPCVGDGVSGQRVEVVYAHGSSRGAASSALRADIRRWVGQVEWTIGASAERHGGARQVRWRTDGCDLRITSHRVSNAALNDFGTMIDELRSSGFSRSDRTYLLFTDATRYCGIATAPRDDRASSNRADRETGYARVDRNCWDAGDEGYHSIAAHELVHTLGAVQSSAPNATPGAHCTDDHDLLCYDDGTGGDVRIRCRDNDSGTSGAGDAFDRLLDCGGDDYFDPTPARGSYLDTHWNTADSARLHDPSAPSGGGSSSSSGGSGGSGSPSPTSNPIGFVFDLVFG